MHTRNAIKPMKLDELAAAKLAAGLIAAIDEIMVEQIIWSRRQTMHVSDHHAVFPAAQVANERTLPVVVLGGMVIMPRIGPVPLAGITKGRSYRAIEAALAGDHEVLLISVLEAEIEGFRATEPQPLPPVGVIARIVEGVKQPDGTLRVVLDGVSRAVVTGRVQHEPFYRATCIPQPDPEIESVEAQILLGEVKARVMEIVQTMPDAPPEASVFVNQIRQPGNLADVVAYGPMFAFEDRLDLLGTLDPMERLQKIQRLLGV